MYFIHSKPGLLWKPGAMAWRSGDAQRKACALSTCVSYKGAHKHAHTCTSAYMCICAYVYMHAIGTGSVRICRSVSPCACVHGCVHTGLYSCVHLFRCIHMSARVAEHILVLVSTRVKPSCLYLPEPEGLCSCVPAPHLESWIGSPAKARDGWLLAQGHTAGLLALPTGP